MNRTEWEWAKLGRNSMPYKAGQHDAETRQGLKSRYKDPLKDAAYQRGYYDAMRKRERKRSILGEHSRGPGDQAADPELS